MIRLPSKIIRHNEKLAGKPLLQGPQIPVVAAKQGMVKLSNQPSTWAELHLRALTQEGQPDHFWLALFGARISGGCDCRKNWKKELLMLPPDFKNYFFWSVAIHNMVNVRLGKPQITIDEARKIWVVPTLTQPAQSEVPQMAV